MVPRMRIGKETGFTYLAALIAVALFGVVLAATGMVWQTVARREKERELLFVGNQFRRAIQLYYETTPGGVARRYPASLDDLLKDNRQPSTQRYLRKIYVDPMTRSAEWGLVPAPGGGILGVYSLSEEVPIKSGNFAYADRDFENKSKYSEWKFLYVAGSAPSQKPAASQQPTPQTAPLTQQSAQPKFSLPVSPMQMPQQPAK